MAEKDKAFDVLLDYANRSVQGARGLPAQVDIKPFWTGIGFSLAGHRLVAPMSEVAEMIVPPPATRLPGVQPWVKGVSNVRGRLLPLIDLESFFGGGVTSASSRQNQRVLALELGELYTGLLVNEVYGMKHFAVDCFSHELPEGLEQMEPYLAGCYRQGDELWTVFSPYKLTKDQRFMNAAAG